MNRSIDELETIVRNRICRVCDQRAVDGSCGMEDPSDCALFEMFPMVAKAILDTTSDDIRDYVRAIRASVCEVCLRQSMDGICETRDQVRCSLDAYLPLVVDAIEEATGKSFDRGALDSQIVPIG